MIVSVEYLDEDTLTGRNNDPAWYVIGDMNTVIVVSVDNKPMFGVVCVGEMRIDRPSGEVWRYTSDLYENDFNSDFELLRIDPDEWSNNAWFEIMDYETDETNGAVFHDVQEALNFVMEIVKGL